MHDRLIRTVWNGEYELQYYFDPKGFKLIEGTVTVYFPLERQTYSQHLIPCEKLNENWSARLAPFRRFISKRIPSWHGFVDETNTSFTLDSEGLRVEHPRTENIVHLVEHLRQAKDFERYFKPSGLPEARWDNLWIEPVPLSPGFEEYLSTLRQMFTDGYVECREYQIADGPVEESVLHGKTWKNTPSMFVELFRHPYIRDDFEIQAANEQELFEPKNWTAYSPFFFSGLLAQTLVNGGIRRNMKENVEAALMLADNAFKDINRDYHNFTILVCNRDWYKRLHGFGGAHTWVILDREMRRLIVFIASDDDRAIILG